MKEIMNAINKAIKAEITAKIIVLFSKASNCPGVVILVIIIEIFND